MLRILLAISAALVFGSAPDKRMRPGNHLLGIVTILVAAVCVGVAKPIAEAAPAAASTRAVPGTIAYSACSVKDGAEGCKMQALYAIRIDGSRRRLLVQNGSDPAWSPNGRQIAYASGRGGIWIASADGTNRRRLTTPPHRFGALDNEPGWSRDGRRIVFHREWEGEDDVVVDLYAVEVSTRRLVRLTHTPNFWEFHPDWSPDGKQIAYMGGDGGDADGIRVLELATGRTKRLTSGFHEKPDWSPDGTKIAFAVVGGAGPGAIVVMRQDGSRRRKVVASAGPWRWFGSPAWSPDGSRIVYDAAVGEGARRIAIVRADGKGRRFVVRNGVNPDWRP